MRDRDRFTDPAVWRDDLVHAAAFLTRLPAHRLGPLGAERALSGAGAAFPVVGLAVGAIAALTYAVAYALDVPPLAAALLAVGAGILATGGLHEDGLADTADGFGGGADAETRLAIMRDARSGAFGVIALVLSIGLRAAALAAGVNPGEVALSLLAAHAVSRAVLPAALWGMDPARADGLGAAAGRPNDATVVVALGIAALVALLCLGLGGGVAALVGAGLAGAAVAAVARQRIGGYTGDVLGALQQVVEVTVLIIAAATR